MQNTNSYRRAGRGALTTFLMLAAALLVAAGQAHAQVSRVVDTNFSDSVVNQCTGETISFSGTMTTTTSFFNNGSRTNMRSTIDVKANGVVTADAFGQPVTNGVKFKVQSRDKALNDQINPVVFPFQQVQEVDTKLVGAGPDNNFFFSFTARVNFNGQGEVTVVKEASRLRCETTKVFGGEVLYYGDKTTSTYEEPTVYRQPAQPVYYY